MINKINMLFREGFGVNEIAERLHVPHNEVIEGIQLSLRHQNNGDDEEEDLCDENLRRYRYEQCELLLIFGIKGRFLYEFFPEFTVSQINCIIRHLKEQGLYDNTPSNDRFISMSFNTYKKHFSNRKYRVTMSIFLKIYHNLGGDRVFKGVDFHSMITAHYMTKEILEQPRFQSLGYPTLNPNQVLFLIKELACGGCYFEYCETCGSMYVASKCKEVEASSLESERYFKCPYCMALSNHKDMGSSVKSDFFISDFDHTIE